MFVFSRGERILFRSQTIWGRLRGSSLGLVFSSGLRVCALGFVKLSLLGGSWVVICGAISPLIWVIAIVTLLITPLITTYEPPSRVSGLSFRRV